MKASAYCPNCSWADDYMRVYHRDQQITVEPDDKYTTKLRRCPSCEPRVRMNIRGPVIPVRRRRRAARSGPAHTGVPTDD